jgi:hypothetical protein
MVSQNDVRIGTEKELGVSLVPGVSKDQGTNRSTNKHHHDPPSTPLTRPRTSAAPVADEGFRQEIRDSQRQPEPGELRNEQNIKPFRQGQRMRRARRVGNRTCSSMACSEELPHRLAKRGLVMGFLGSWGAGCVC